MADKNILSKGIDFYNRKKYEDALTFFLTLPSDAAASKEDIAYYLGLCYAKLKRYEDALLYLEQVVTSGKNSERVLQSRFILAVIYILTGRKKLADFELNKLLNTGYKPAAVYAAIAYVAWEQKEIEKCMECYNKALKIDPENVTALNGLGYVLAYQEKDLTKALSYCKKALSKSPDSPACTDSLGYVYYKMGILEDAKKYFFAAQELDKDNKEIAEHIRIVTTHEENK